MKPVIIYLDEEPKALRINGRRLNRCLGDEAELIMLEPNGSREEMVERIFSYEMLSSVILDQQLTAAGTANFLGTELAEAIRHLDRKIPVYILTNYPDDLDAYDGNVEYILNKDDLLDGDRLDAIAMRLRRHVNVYRDILGERDAKFESLLRKFHAEGLTDSELEEYEELGFYRERKILASELIDAENLRKKICMAEDALKRVQDLLDKKD